ncbi:MAG: zinc-finger domain-containing protein [Gammaproteobacteria bacterium]|nr:zinc-finger domain-containing protein [Gammaproteobacteria bacterium]
MKEEKLIEPNAQNRDAQGRTNAAGAGRAGAAYEVTRADLPLHCPMKGMSLWNSHPRVYLPIEASGQERCPYCGAVYVLKVR